MNICAICNKPIKEDEDFFRGIGKIKDRLSHVIVGHSRCVEQDEWLRGHQETLEESAVHANEVFDAISETGDFQVQMALDPRIGAIISQLQSTLTPFQMKILNELEATYRQTSLDGLRTMFVEGYVTAIDTITD